MFVGKLYNFVALDIINICESIFYVYVERYLQHKLKVPFHCLSVRRNYNNVANQFIYFIILSYQRYCFIRIYWIKSTVAHFRAEQSRLAYVLLIYLIASC